MLIEITCRILDIYIGKLFGKANPTPIPSNVMNMLGLNKIVPTVLIINFRFLAPLV